jgi:hypothetical protein
MRVRLEVRGKKGGVPLNFSEAFGLSLFLSGCHFRAAFLEGC